MTHTPTFTVAARTAGSADLDRLSLLYAGLADEQRAIRAIWPHADGLAAPVRSTIATLVDDGAVTVGTIDGHVVGWLVTRTEPLLAPEDDRRIGVIHLVFVEPDARGVGVGAAMLDHAVARLVAAGIDLFDAPVSPGHRLAKNFFESNGFKARSIIMHRSGAPEPADTEPGEGTP